MSELPRPGSRVRLKGLTKPEYNDLEGTVKESQRAAAEGRLCIVLDGDALPSCPGLTLSVIFAPAAPGR